MSLHRLGQTEEWRSCFGGLYAVSSLGRVRRQAPGKGTWSGRIIAPATSGAYHFVDLYCGGGEHRVVSVHRLVAEAFLGLCPPGHEVNHKSGVKADNRSANLEYVTRSENHHHAYRIGLRSPQKGERHGAAILTEDAVRDIRRRRSAGAGLRALASRYHVSVQAVCAVTKRRSWSHVL